jgi:hypothetical protein
MFSIVTSLEQQEQHWQSTEISGKFERLPSGKHAVCHQSFPFHLAVAVLADVFLLPPFFDQYAKLCLMGLFIFGTGPSIQTSILFFSHDYTIMYC